VWATGGGANIAGVGAAGGAKNAGSTATEGAKAVAWIWAILTELATLYASNFACVMLVQ
jgi:hypothetical protein